MSYAGPASTRAPRRTPRSNPDLPEIDSHDDDTDWQQVAIFGAGLAVGVALGAGIALLTAPQAGWKTRSDIRRFAKNKRRALQRRSRDAWLDLRDELHDAARKLRRRKRAATSRPRSPGGLRPDIDDR